MISTRCQVTGLWYATKLVLNNLIDEDPDSHDLDCSSADLVNAIRIQMLKLKAYMSPDGRKVNYGFIRDSPAYRDYLVLVNRLRFLNVGDLTLTEWKGLLINIYNCLVVHAILEGCLEKFPWGMLARLQMYSMASYNIGGTILSLTEIENGLLRRNRPPPTPFTSVPFSSEQDPRLSLMLHELDSRIHFALNCGALSCPAICVYASETSVLDRQLQDSTELYLDENVNFDVSTKSITLSLLFSWYKIDFGNSDKEVLSWIKAHASQQLSLKFLQFDNLCEFKIGDVPTINYEAYNWTTNMP